MWYLEWCAILNGLLKFLIDEWHIKLVHKYYFEIKIRSLHLSDDVGFEESFKCRRVHKSLLSSVASISMIDCINRLFVVLSK